MTQASPFYRPEIDGLRGIAILAVVINHVDSRLLPGGFVGVDVFFVISGYLITSILLRESSHGSLSFMRFYTRRVLRLLPAAAVMAAIVTLLASAMFLPRDFKDLGASLVAYSAMASNFLFWRWDDYFAGQTRSWPLLHTWSLAVEEQFYLVFPLLVAWNAKRARLFQAAVFVALCVLSFSLSVWQCSQDVRSAYYLLPSRSWELLVGAICAIVPLRTGLSVRLTRWLGLASMVCVLAPMSALSEQSVFPGWAALVPVCGTAGLIAVTSQRSSIWQRVLATPSLVWIGLMSYSLYLWHWPLLTLARYPWSGMAGSCPRAVSYLVGILSVFVAWLSFQFVETPGRRIRWSEANVLCLWVLVGLGTAGCGLIIHRNQGLPQRLPAQVVRLSRGMEDWQPRRAATIDLPVRTIQSGNMPRIGCEETVGRCDFVLWGDSHADALVPAFDHAARERRRSGVALTRGATPPLVGIRIPGSGRHSPNWAFRDAAMGYLQRERPPVVVLAARWSALLDWKWPIDRRAVSTYEQKQECIATSITETLAVLSNAGVERVWIMGEVPSQRFHVPKQLALHELFGWQYVGPFSEAKDASSTPPLSAVFQKVVNDRVSVLHTAVLLSQVSENGLLVNGGSAYTDDTHISVTAALAIAPYLSPIFDDMDNRRD